MSAPPMDRALATALAQGRSLIVPTPQHAARLALAWARTRLAAGDAVWQSPDILTWDAWLAREWVRCRDQDAACAPRLLNRAQERALWTQVLEDLDARGGAGEEWGAPLSSHAGALMRAAHRMSQWLLEPPRTGTAEERLLSAALREVRARCDAQGVCIAGLAGVTQLAGLSSGAPLVAGVTGLAPLQQRLGEMLWPGTALLAPLDDGHGAQPVALRAASPHEEIHAAARWCRSQLAADGRRRLLVIDAARGRSLRGVAAEFWNEFARGTDAAFAPQRDPRLLAVRGGESLVLHAMVNQALEALTLPGDVVDVATLGRVLRSPYFGWPEEQAARLDTLLRGLGRAHWKAPELHAALEQLAAEEPLCAQLSRVLREAAATLDAATSRPTSQWAAAFDRALSQLGFPGRRSPDSRDAQRLMRWRELLDEFASLEVFGDRPGFDAALRDLGQLARLGAHEAAGADAAITLTADRSDPLVGYDGIWVLGLSGDCWPEPPRPDPFVPLALQRQAQWPEAGVAQRQRQAQEELAAWRRRARELVLSHAAHVDGVHQRPSRLLQDLAWQSIEPADHAPAPAARLEAGPADVLPAMPAPREQADARLPGALRALQLQQACPFRAQAEQRLGAVERETPVDGIDPRLRGQLLHAALERLWDELRDHATLCALAVEARHECIDRSWRAAEQAVLRRWPAPPTQRALERERRRSRDVLDAVLQTEMQRAPFAVAALEHRLTVSMAGRQFNLRVDRIDRLDDDTRLVIDYKAGHADRILLEEGPLQPLQLALYATALAAAGEPVDAVALQSLAASQKKFAGVRSDAHAKVAGLAPLADWDAQLQRWNAQLLQLLADFLGGNATVAPQPGACRTCPLPALCRVGDIAVGENGAAEQGDD